MNIGTLNRTQVLQRRYQRIRIVYLNVFQHIVIAAIIVTVNLNSFVVLSIVI